ncbi:MAG: hypothetical protein B6I22_01670 [Desulfobacteraceae bacterium 4572_123]|nr:MAG: hypothetical protein B6I22_01670 [Desulfobacteraceae bacterium 4572_123]
MEENKKMVAAISAVMSYISQEQSMTVEAGDAAGGQVPGFSAPAAPVKMWGLSGRLARMQMRNQMQLKSFHGARLR